MNLLEKKFNNINLITYTNSLDKYYPETLFCFGACGISLYERVLWHTICMQTNCKIKHIIIKFFKEKNYS